MKIVSGNWFDFLKELPKFTLNGAPISHVFEADDTEGYMVVGICEDGKPLTDSNGYFITKRLAGKIEIIGERRDSVSASPESNG
jgi:hypothetical protein